MLCRGIVMCCAIELAVKREVCTRGASCGGRGLLVTAGCRPPCILMAPFLHPPCPLTMPSMLSLPLLLTLSTLPLACCFQGTKVERVINELFEGHTLNFIECIHVDYKSSRKESFMDLQVGVGGH